ncbi:MAG TPA: VPLPA-CTERM sorting domain-containing protein [Syntrophorhabdaceae bacterium]|nr:VPLPA-CTERM sorting domain-containing protein [Syntrophorhabdaceae bacterium]
MQTHFRYISLALLAVLLLATSSYADDIRFTATGVGNSLTGYVQYDYATFKAQTAGALPWNAVFAQNSAITGLSFSDPEPEQLYDGSYISTSFATSDVFNSLAATQSALAFETDNQGNYVVFAGGGWLVQYLVPNSNITLTGMGADGGQVTFRWGGRPGWDPSGRSYNVTWSTGQIIPTATPLPPGLLLMAPGFLGLVAVRRRFKK